MGKWLYLAQVAQGINTMLKSLGVISLGVAFFNIVGLSNKEAKPGEITKEEEKRIVRKFREKTKKIAILGLIFLNISLFIPTKRRSDTDYVIKSSKR